MKKSKRTLIIIIICLCVALAGGGAFAFFQLKNSPKRKLLQAANTLSAAITAAADEEKGQPDLNKLAALYTSGEYAMSYNASLRNSYYTEETMIEGKSLLSTSDKKMKSSNKVDFNTFGKISMDIYAEDDKVYMLYPGLMEEGSFVIPLEQYEAGLFQTPPSEITDATEITSELQKNIVAMMLVAGVEDIPDKAGEYHVILPKDKVNEAFGGKAKLDSDMVLTVTLAEDKYVTQITNEGSPLAIDGIGDATLKMTFQWDGESLSSTGIIAKAEKLSMDYNYTYEDAKYVLTAEYEQSGVKAKISFEGKIKTEKDSDEITLNIDRFQTYMDEKQVMSVDGLVVLSPLSEEIEKPEHLEPEFDITSMSMEDYAKLYDMVGDKILGLLH